MTTRKNTPVPGWQKLLDDVAAVREKFADPKFKGAFDMNYFGRLESKLHPKNHCGTSACLGGWLGLLGKHDFRARFDPESKLLEPIGHGLFSGMATAVYGLTNREADTLFFAGLRMKLKGKLRQAEKIARTHAKAERAALKVSK
jgi:hypothetical protein